MSDTVNTPVEYALYALACQHPDLFAEAERFVGGMLAEDQGALRRVRALQAHKHRTPANVTRVLDEGISTWTGWPPA